MRVNLVKMCVGIDDIEQLRYWQAKRLKGAADKKLLHITRNRPKREEELLDGGSLYWVIKGQIRVRQRVIERSSAGDVLAWLDERGTVVLVGPPPRDGPAGEGGVG